MDFQQSQTFINLQNAYKYELQSTAKFEVFSKRAEQEVLLGISNIFSTASRNNSFIAERLRRLLYDGDTTTAQNLQEAAEEEAYAQNNLYQEYSRIASEEGFNDLASLFNGIGNIKLNHTFAFRTAEDEMQNNTLFCKPGEVLWVCLGCGNILSGVCAPAVCPICGYPQGYYQLL